MTKNSAAASGDNDALERDLKAVVLRSEDAFEGERGEAFIASLQALLYLNKLRWRPFKDHSLPPDAITDDDRFQVLSKDAPAAYLRIDGKDQQQIMNVIGHLKRFDLECGAGVAKDGNAIIVTIPQSTQRKLNEWLETAYMLVTTVRRDRTATGRA